MDIGKVAEGEESRLMESMIFEYPVVPEDCRDDYLFVAARHGYYIFYKSRPVASQPPKVESETLRTSHHESGYGYVVFETLQQAEAFANGNDQSVDIISAAKWSEGLEAWSYQQFSDYWTAQLRQAEERVKRIEALIAAGKGNENTECALLDERQRVQDLQQNPAKWESLIDQAISDLLAPTGMTYPASTRETWANIVFDLRAKVPYAVDPMREYTLVYERGRFSGGTMDEDELAISFDREGNHPSWFLEPLGAKRYMCAVTGMTRRHGDFHINQVFRNPLNRDNEVTVNQMWDTGAADPTLHHGHLNTIDPGHGLPFREKTYTLADGRNQVMDVVRLEARVEDANQGPVTD